MKTTVLRAATIALCTAALMLACDDDDSDTDGGAGTDGGSNVDGGGGGSDGGGGTDGGTTEVAGNFCQEECSDNEDCTIGGSDTGFTCDTASSRCVSSAATGCTDDDECVIIQSRWALADTDGDFVGDAPCTADGPEGGADCAAGEVCCITGQVCVEPGGCATPAGGAVACSTLTLAEIAVAPIGGGDDIMVCGTENADDATCNDAGACENPCNVDDDCSELLPSCNTTTGQCECTTTPSDSCADATAGGTVCIDGTCGCEDNDDCEGDTTDECFDGVCGCSAASVCPSTTTFDGTTAVCEEVP